MTATIAHRRVEKSLLRRESLGPAQEREMFELFSQYYDHVDWQSFRRDLAEKTHVFVFREAGSRRLIGFSTIYRRALPDITPGLFLFSGDTVIHEDYWGNKMLQKSFFWFIVSSKLRSPLRPVYWMLMSKGVKTYLMMRKNFGVSYPREGATAPPRLAMALHGFYRQKFGADYDPAASLIRFPDKRGEVKQGLVTPEAIAQAGPDAAYFARVNPGHVDGVELACIAEIRFADFGAHLLKYFLPHRG
jgi:hypothetical protein